MSAEITREWLPVTAEVSLPLLTARGVAPGPVLAVTAGVHGDEYEGVRAIFDVFEALDPNAMRGMLLAVPVVNPPAHRAVSRVSPVDGANLARVFPGDPEGTLSERIADTIARQVITGADFYLDLHSGGVRYGMPSMAGYFLGDARGRAAAEAFGAPVIWGHPLIEPGRTISVAHAAGIPFLYTEAWGAGRIAAGDLQMMTRGIGNLLRHLGMMPGEPEIPAPARRLRGAGNTDDGLSAGSDGFLLQDVSLLDRVYAGQRLGRLADYHGRTIETYLASRDATVALTHEMPVVAKGDTLFLLADEE
jgi:predicted deacylase